MDLEIKHAFAHAFTLANTLSALREEEETCDFTIIVGQDTFRAHRVVLAACSDYFKALIHSRMKEVNEGCVTLEGFKPKPFKIFLDYIYSGEATVPLSICSEVIQMADMLLCLGLKSQCLELLEENLCVENCLRVKGIAKDLGLSGLLELSEQVCIESFAEIVMTEDFVALDLGDFIHILKSSSEDMEIVWEAIVIWTNSKHERKSNFGDLLDLLNLENCGFQFLFRKAWPEGIVQELADTRKVVANALLTATTPKDITQENCFELLRLTHTYCKDKMDIIWDFLWLNLECCSQSRDLNSLTKEDIINIYKKIQVWSEITWQILVKWVKEDKRTRRKCLIDVLGNVDITSLNFDLVYNKIMKDNLVMNSEKIMDMAGFLSLKLMKYPDVDVTNWYDLLHLARASEDRKYGLQANLILDFMKRNFPVIMKHEKLVTVEPSDFVQVLGGIAYQAGSLLPNGHSELIPPVGIWEAITSWMRFQDSRKGHLTSVLSALNLNRLSFGFLFETLANDAIVKASRQDNAMVISAALSAMQYKDLSSQNWFQILHCARRSKPSAKPTVVNTIRDYLISNFEEIAKSDEFLNFTVGDLIHIAKNEKLSCSCEVKWNALMRWVKYDSEKRKASLAQLLTTFDLDKLSHDFLKDTIFSEPLVKKSEECKTMIIEALFRKAEASREVKTDPKATVLNQSMTYHQNRSQVPYATSHYFSGHTFGITSQRYAAPTNIQYLQDRRNLVRPDVYQYQQQYQQQLPSYTSKPVQAKKGQASNISE